MLYSVHGSVLAWVTFSIQARRRPHASCRAYLEHKQRTSPGTKRAAAAAAAAVSGKCGIINIRSFLHTSHSSPELSALSRLPGHALHAPAHAAPMYQRTSQGALLVPAAGMYNCPSRFQTTLQTAGRRTLSAAELLSYEFSFELDFGR